MDFLSWIANRTMGKLLFYTLLAIPVIVLVGFLGGMSHKKKNDESRNLESNDKT